MNLIRRSRFAFAALLALAACGDGGGGIVDPPPPVVSSVAVSGPSAPLVAGSTAQLTATALTANSQAVSGRTVQWQSSSDAVATVGATGIVTAVAPGTARITATVDGISGGMDVTVRAPVASVRVAPSPADVAVGATVQLAATPLDAAGTAVTGAGGVTWESADVSIATVDATGVVRGVSGGTVEIRATVDGVRGTTTARVAFPLPAGLRFSVVSAGSLHACGLDTEGRAWCWGLNQGSQLGASSTETCSPSGTPIACSRYPLPVSGGLRFTALSAGTEGGSQATCAVTTTSRVACWGDGGYGKLGNGGTQSSRTPVMPNLPAGKTFTQTGVGARYACALASDGTAYCWGDNFVGTLGNGSPFADYVSTPVQVLTDERFASLWVGPLTACGITTDGRAFCWGQLPTQQARTPTAVAAAHRFTKMTSGGGISSDTHLCGLRTDGQVLCWGNNSAGQLGIPVENGNGFANPVVAMGGLTYTNVSAGSGYTCGLQADGTLRCAGRNENGELGIGTTGRTDVPTRVEGFAFRTISTGWFSCGIGTDGLAYCWGRNDYGELGTTEGQTCQSHPGVPVIPCALRPVKVRGQD